MSFKFVSVHVFSHFSNVLRHCFFQITKLGTQCNIITFSKCIQHIQVVKLSASFISYSGYEQISNCFSNNFKYFQLPTSQSIKVCKLKLLKKFQEDNVHKLTFFMVTAVYFCPPLRSFLQNQTVR